MAIYGMTNSVLTAKKNNSLGVHEFCFASLFTMRFRAKFLTCLTGSFSFSEKKQRHIDSAHEEVQQMRQSAFGCVFGEFGCIFADKRTRVLFLMTEVDIIEQYYLYTNTKLT